MDEPGTMPGSFEPISGAVSEHIAARRLGLSVDTLRRDRRLGQLGIPFVKYGSRKCGAVRYDLADLERFIAESKRRTLPSPVVKVQAPARPVMPALPPIEPEELPELPPERIDPQMPTRPKSPWEILQPVVKFQYHAPLATPPMIALRTAKTKAASAVIA